MRHVVLMVCLCVLFVPRVGTAQVRPPESASSVSDSETSAATQESSEEEKPWWERLSFSGDYRLRLETFRVDGTPDRTRARMRLRLAVDADVAEGLGVHFRLASGDPIDPSSSNQTFTDYLTEKPFTIDYGYVAYEPRAVEGLTLAGGKFEPPVPHTSMTWEDNHTWEGSYEQFTSRNGAVQFTATAAQVVFSEVKAGRDSLMFAESGELVFGAGDHEFSVAVTDHVFRNPDPIAVAIADGKLDLPNTNLITFGSDGAVQGFASGFHWVDVLGTALFETSREQYPVKLTANWVKNARAVTDEDTGVWVAGTYGRAEEPKTYALTYAYTTIEQDAVLSPYMNADVERTNVRASIVELVYKPTRPVAFVVSGFFPRWLRLPAGEPNPVLKRMQFNVEVEF